jgi:hypothetical protein
MEIIHILYRIMDMVGDIVDTVGTEVIEGMGTEGL